MLEQCFSHIFEMRGAFTKASPRAAHLMQSFGILQVLHADFEAVRVGYAGPFNLRVIFLWHVQSSKLVLWMNNENKRNI